MGTSETKTIGQALARMGLSECPEEQRTCDTHGAYKALYLRGKFWTGCPGCTSERNEQEAREREEHRQREIRERRAALLLGRAAIPARFSDRRLSNYVPQCDKSRKAHEVAVDFAQNFKDRLKTGSGLILCGGVGTGKTHLAIGIAHEVLAMNLSPVFTSVMSAVRAVKETYRRDHDLTERQAIDRFVEPDLLILDEVGVQFGSDTEKLILFEIINGRYEEMRPTIVISNLAKDALEKFIGERAFDRLREGGGKLVAFDWPSHRRAA